VRSCSGGSYIVNVFLPASDKTILEKFSNRNPGIYTCDVLWPIGGRSVAYHILHHEKLGTLRTARRKGS
jgi:hypothetical protein